MTRDEALTRVRTSIEKVYADSVPQLVLDLARQGVPPEQILEAYHCAVEWNEQALIDSLKQIEQALDAAIQHLSTEASETPKSSQL